MFDITKEDIEAAPKIPKSPGNCTVISIVPFSIREIKPQVMPGYFQIPACREPNTVQALPVGESIYWMESPYKGMPPIKITETPRAMAKSIVNDYIEAQLATDTDVAPGLFWVEGHYDNQSALRSFPNEIKELRIRQDRWFVNLVRIADDDWQQTHQHRFVSDIQRHAAKALGMLDREWLSVTVDSIQISCPLCKEMVRQDAIIHNVCGYIMDLDAYDKLKSRIVSKETLAQLGGLTK